MVKEKDSGDTKTIWTGITGFIKMIGAVSCNELTTMEERSVKCTLKSKLTGRSMTTIGG